MIENYTMAKLFILLLMFSIGLCDECRQLSGNNKACQCKTKSGFVIDLEKIRLDQKFHKVTGKRKTHDSAQYSFSPCKALTFAKCNGFSVCQNSSGSYFNAGSPLKPNTNPFYWDPSKHTLTVNYTGDGKRKSVVQFLCSNSGEEFEALGETGNHTEIYKFEVKTKHVCVESPKKGGGLSTGSILCIVFLVLLFVYFVGGFLFLRYARGARGVEQVPHLDFWKELPLLIWDGVVFLKNGCKTSSVYDQI